MRLEAAVREDDSHHLHILPSGLSQSRDDTSPLDLSILFHNEGFCLEMEWGLRTPQ